MCMFLKLLDDTLRYYLGVQKETQMKARKNKTIQSFGEGGMIWENGNSNMYTVM